MIVALSRADETLTFSLKAPCFNGLPCDSMMWDSTGQGYVRAEPTDSLNDLKEIRIYGSLFDAPDTVLLGSFPAVPCSSYTFALTVASGKMGFIIPRAVDNWGNESCIGEQFLFATKALDFQLGLHAAYFDNEDLTNLRVTRIDPTVDFDWGFSSPDTSIGIDTFSAQWDGYVLPTVSGVYTFYFLWEDGGRVWVGSTYIVNDWGINSEHETHGQSVTLSAGLLTPIRIQYMAHNGHASCHLMWVPPGGVKTVIPAANLFH